MQNISNINVDSVDVLLTPEELNEQAPLTERAAATVLHGREALQRILDRQDHRLCPQGRLPHEKMLNARCHIARIHWLLE